MNPALNGFFPKEWTKAEVQEALDLMVEYGILEVAKDGPGLDKEYRLLVPVEEIEAALADANRDN